MLIRFWFGAIHIGRPSHIGDVGAYDVSITWCWGRRGYDTPPGELPWRLVARLAWNWLPDVGARRVRTSVVISVIRVATVAG